ncbi:MAG: ABC transporter permease [Lachnospiraceae bacterium]|nr:ABC transporter permease [Lachnospiraceae bacterium]
MMTCKLIFGNLKKNMKDYSIYFMTLMLAVSLFYAFNSATGAEAVKTLGSETQIFTKALGSLIEAASVAIALLMAFLILYVNQFLLKRRKKELGIYMLLGMKKGKISRIFVGETFVIGIASLAAGIILGIFLGQFLVIAVLKSFGGAVNNFTLSFSVSAFRITVICFAVIYVVAMVFNVLSVSKVKLIELLSAGRKNENLKRKHFLVYVCCFIAAIVCLAGMAVLFRTEELLPQKENLIRGVVLLVIATFLLFYSITAVVFEGLQKSKKFYFKRLNCFLVRQIGSRIQSNYLSMSAVCLLLTVTILMLTTGFSIAFTMSDVMKESAPYEFMLMRNAKEGEKLEKVDLLAELKSENIDVEKDVEESICFAERKADITYSVLFEGQNVSLWDFDSDLEERRITVLGLSDYNKCLVMSGKEPVSLGENEYYLNCNYKGTHSYMEYFIKKNENLEIAGVELSPKQNTLLENTYALYSVGIADRGTLILPDDVAGKLKEEAYYVAGNFYNETNVENINKMLDETITWDKVGGYQYGWNTKMRMQTAYYTSFSLPVFIVAYIGLIFLLICVALLSVQQLTEISDNKMRYLILNKQGVTEKMMKRTIEKQVGVYFLAPLLLATAYAVVSVKTVVAKVSTFYNMEIGTNVWGTMIVLLLVYGGYYCITSLSCKKMILRSKEWE